MKPRQIFLIIAIAFFLASFCAGAFAEQPSSEGEIVVKLKANSLKYDENKGVAFATGSVEAKMKGFTVNSDMLLFDANSNVVTAEGDVRISSADYSATGTSLHYDASSEISSVGNFYAIFSPSDIKGKLYVRVDDFYNDPSMMWGKESDMTTCDYDVPHYDIKAKRFEFYPGDKLVAFSATFYINRVPVMWFPVWVYSLKNRRSSLMPVIGHNMVEGNFAKFGFDYFFNNNSNGLILVDLMQWKGLGKGIQHFYRLNDNNYGTLYFYHLEERDTGKTGIVEKVDHVIQIDPETKLDLYGKFADIYLVPSGRLDQTYGKVALDHLGDRKFNLLFDALDDRWGGMKSYNLNVNHSIDKYSTSFSSNFSKGIDVPSWIRFNSRFSHTQPIINDNITFSTIVNFSRNSTSEFTPADERLDPQVELVDVEKEFTVRAFQNWYIDTDRDLYTADRNTEYLEKKPEITVSLKPRNLEYFTLSTNVGVAKYHEVKWVPTTSTLRNYTADRYNVNLQADRSIGLPVGSNLSLMGAVEQYFYSPGDERYVLRERAGLSTNLWNFFSNSIEYQKGKSEGNTPFFFDVVGVDNEYLNETMTLYWLDKVRWINGCGYNYKSRLYNDLTTRLTVRPEERISSSVSTGYDLNNHIWRDLVFDLGLKPLKAISWAWHSVHDINNNLFKSGTSLLDAEIGDDWRYKFHIIVGHEFDYFTGRFIMRDLTVEKDLHCWSMRFTYSDWRQEWRISFTLKAFPDQPVGWGAGENGSFFEGLPLPDYLQQSPTRY